MERGRREGDGVSSRSCGDFHNPRSCIDNNIEHIGAGEQWYRYCMESDGWTWTSRQQLRRRGWKQLKMWIRRWGGTQSLRRIADASLQERGMMWRRSKIHLRKPLLKRCFRSKGHPQKNFTGLFGNFSQMADPPTPTPPFWEPLIQKKFYRLFCILDP